jgi:hypothetical protein
MIAPIDPATLPAPAQKIVSPDGPAKLKQMAAKGIVPGLRPDALLGVLVLLSGAAERDVATSAEATLAKLPDPVLKGALQADLPAASIDMLARNYTNDLAVLERLLHMPQLDIESVEYLAQHGDEAATELVATNQERMLAHPKLIELLYMNKNTRMSTADRLVELAVRNDVEVGIPAWREAAQAIQGELIAEPSDEPLPEDEFFKETDEVAAQLARENADDAFYEDEEGEERLDDKLLPLHQRMSEMTVSQKIRRAMLGTKEERMMLIREQNKVVASAAARSPLMQEPEVAQVTRMRSVSEEVLRIIGNTPEWMKSYQVKRNLVENSKTPVAIAQRIVPQLREADLKKLMSNRNVSGAVQRMARNHMKRRKT